ncbi:hypothetical protein GOODEAATRI_029558 [Goodea atripinnis]|uniref:Uncharacterized protein n=1 Tax=Goodea atripinnis TaxID=208336 RepID=A0ABV0NPG8_9TELE
MCSMVNGLSLSSTFVVIPTTQRAFTLDTHSPCYSHKSTHIHTPTCKLIGSLVISAMPSIISTYDRRKLKSLRDNYTEPQFRLCPRYKCVLVRNLKSNPNKKQKTW